ncbi:MAG TPA: sodium:solute symporter family protein [Chitinophagales bacterium]|nr:sodium:solute symporter family protein [Chitinophagales bacterium]
MLYLAVTVLIGVAATRYIGSSQDYMIAGRKLPLFISSAALFALWFGSETVFGASAEFIDRGLIGVIEDPFGGVLCLVVFALVFARPLYRMNLLTLGDLYRNRYGKTVELAAGVCMVLTFFGYIAAQLVAMGILLSIVMKMPLPHCILLSSAVVTLYTLAGGMWAVSITDLVQSIVIVIGLGVTAVVIAIKSGGVMSLLDAAPEGFFRFLPEKNTHSIIEYVCAWMTLGFGALASQDIFQRANSASSESVAVRSTYFAAVLYLLVSLIPLFIGLAARVRYPGMLQLDSQEILPRMVLAHTSIAVQILFFGALLSAILSTASGAILAPASILTENIIKPLSPKHYDDRHFLRLLRVSVLVIAAVSTGMAMSGRRVFELVGESYILGLVSLLVPMVAAIYWKHATSLGALLSIIFGMGAWIIFEWAIEIGLPGMIPALAASVTGMAVGSWRKIVRSSQ